MPTSPVTSAIAAPAGAPVDDRHSITQAMPAVTSETPADIPAIAGFALIRRLGSGAMGDVFQARHVDTGELVALKIMSQRLSADPDWTRRFRREIELVKTVRHPHIARAIADGTHDGRLWLALEFIEGPHLGDVLKRSGRLSEVDVLAIGRQVAEVLAQVHAATGMIHRDIKPANLILTSPSSPGAEPVVSLIDFGLARSSADDDQSITSTGMVIGTPSYMSPEQVRGDADVGPSTDLYGLGCTMYHLLTDQVPFNGATAAMVMSAHLTVPVPDPGTVVPGLTPATRQLLMTAMAKTLEERFPSHAAFVEACNAALLVAARGRATTSSSGETPPPLPARARSATAALIVAATSKVRNRHRVKTTQPVLSAMTPSLVPITSESVRTPPTKRNWVILAVLAGGVVAFTAIKLLY